jgi:hypothetical protein
MFPERAFAVKEFPEQMFAFFFSRGYVQCTEQSFDSPQVAEQAFSLPLK